MPNWVEGNIRIRGKRTAIISFLENELESTGYERLIDAPVVGALDVKDDGIEFSVCIPEERRNLSFACIYIKGTRRNFIDDKDICLLLDEEKDTTDTICIDGFKAAWCIEPKPYLEKAKRYGVDIRIVGFERGMQFMQVIEIVDGELRENSEIEYDNWNWDCTMPNMGG